MPLKKKHTVKWSDVSTPLAKRRGKDRKDGDKLPSKARLQSLSKKELIEELVRMYGLTREIMVLWGLVRNVKSSEFVISQHFVPETQALLYLMWSDRL